MRFTFSPEQLALRDACRELLRNECTPAVVREAWSSKTGLNPELWKHLGDLGVLNRLMPETCGGAGGTMDDIVLLVEEAGYFGLSDPIVEHAVVALPTVCEAAKLAGDASALEDSAVMLLARASTGLAVVTASGFDGSFHVVHGQTADAVLAFEGRWISLAETARHLVAVDASFAPAAIRTIDASRRIVRAPVEGWTGSLIVRGVQANKLAHGAALRGAVGTSAMLVGAARRCLDMAVARNNLNYQNGAPVETVRAVSQVLARSAMELEIAKPAVYRAAHTIAEGSPDQDRHASMAKALASDAAQVVARASLQAHGTVGCTVDDDLHLWLCRIEALSHAWGTAARHRDRFATAIGI